MRLIILLIFSGLLFGCGYKDDSDALNEGILVDYKSTRINEDVISFIFHTQQANLININGKLKRVSIWKISYVDKNGKFGSCIYYKEYNTPILKVNSHIKCNDNLKVYFN